MYILNECSKCNEAKLICDFVKSKTCTFGVSNVCKACNSIYKRNYNTINKDSISNKRKIKYEINKDRILSVKKQRYYENRNEILEKQRLFKSLNRDKLRRYYKNYRLVNSESISRKNKKYKESNSNKLKEKNKEYYRLNKDKISKYRSGYIKKRRKEDSLYNLKLRMRSRLYSAIVKNGYVKSNTTESIIGCSFDYLKTYIESKFIDGMSWDNFGSWHIDHIIPLASAKTKEELLKLSHYTNLQPLWAKDNLIKGSKF